jgi:uncharacterized protein involved in exopolysaccharide biosynthesis
MLNLSSERKMTSTNIPPAETILVDLVHDLRQELGNIETSVYCLGLLSDPVQIRARNYLRNIEQQVARAESRLSEAGAELNRLRAQRADTADILDRTKSTTSAVT